MRINENENKIGFSGNNKILGTAADASVSDLVIIGGFDLA